MSTNPYLQLTQQQQQQQQPQQPPAGGSVVVTAQPAYAPPAATEYLKRGARKAVNGMAISQIVMGILCIIFDIALVALYRRGKGLVVNGIGFGIWTGIPLVITGGFGLGAAARNKMAWIITYMVLNIVTVTVFIPNLVGFAATAITVGRYQCSRYRYYSGSYGYSSVVTCNENLLIGLNAVNLAIGVIQFVITIVASAFCCGATCCKPRPAVYMAGVPQPVQYQVQAPTYPHQMVVANPSYAMTQQHHMVVPGSNPTVTQPPSYEKVPAPGY